MEKPDDSLTGFPIWEPIQFAFSEALGNLGTYLRAVYLPFLVIVGSYLLLPFLVDLLPEVFFFRIEIPTGFGPAGPPVTLHGLVWFLMGNLLLLLTAPVFAIWVRMAVFGKEGRHRVERYPFNLGVRHLATVAFGIVFGLELLLSGFFAAFFVLNPEVSGPAILMLGGITVGVFYVSLRLIPVFAGVVCDPSATLHSLWRLTHGGRTQVRLLISVLVFLLVQWVGIQVLSVVGGGVFWGVNDVFNGHSDWGAGSEVVLGFVLGLGGLAVCVMALIGCCYSARIFTYLSSAQTVESNPGRH